MAEIGWPAELVERITERRGRLHCYDVLVPAATALLVVDMQTAFLKPEWPTSLAAAREIVPTVNRLARAVRAAGGQVIWIVSTYGPKEDDRWRILFEHVLGPKAGSFFREVMSEGHEGHAIWPHLEVCLEDATVAKNRFSAFCGSDGRLERLLKECSLDTVLVAGTVTNVCCESTAREAAFRDFKTIMVSDANAARSETDNLVAFSTFIRAFGDVMSSTEVMARLAAGASTVRPAALAEGS
jgi:ureidoacrylate peracid hydrolase